MLSKRKRLGIIIISLLVTSFSAGWIIRGFSEGGNPTIDPILGLYNFPWVNTSIGFNTHSLLIDGVDYTDEIKSYANYTTDHGEMTGLSDDDHPQYLFQDGSEEMAADWDAGSHGINASWFEASEYYLNSENITDLLAYPELPASYVIFTDGSLTHAKNGSTGQIDYSDSNSSAVLLSVLEANSTIYLNGPLYLIFDGIPIKCRIIGVGYVTIETSGGGSSNFIYGADSAAENIYFHEGNNYYHTITHTDQLAFFRYWTDFPHNGGTLTGTPEMIWDGSIDTEMAGYIRTSFLWVENSGTAYGIDVETNGRLHVYKVSDGKRTQNSGLIGVTGSVTTYDFAHQLTGMPNCVTITPAQSGQGLWWANRNATHIMLGFETAPEASNWYFYWWAGV